MAAVARADGGVKSVLARLDDYMGNRKKTG
jgi:hypothetical protein